MSRTYLQPEIIESGTGSGRWQVVIYNNDNTPYNEVIRILMSSTGCGLEEAAMEVWEAETYGKCPVHFSSRNECEIVAVMISSIGVKTEVSREWKD
jgi:ATP-dependent Clp protease adapter protein ClpS